MPNSSRILYNRSLLILGFSESVSGIGNWLTMLAVFTLVVFDGAGSVVASSGIFLAGLLPTLVAGPVAGWLLDRYDRRKMMILAQLLAGLTVAVLVFTDNRVLIYLIVGLEAAFLAVMTPARQAVVPDLVAREDLTKANAFLQQLAAVIKMGAPMLAGLALTVMSAHAVIVLDVITFFISALILNRLPPLPPQQRPCGEAATPPARTCLSILKGSPALRLLFVAIFLGILVIIGLDVLSPIFVRDVLHGNQGFYGLLIGLIGLGTLCASIMLTVRKKRPSPWRDLVAGLLLLATVPGAMWLVTLMRGSAYVQALVLFASLVGGVGNGLLVIQTGTLLQLHTPGEALGRIGGLFQSTAVAGQLVGLLAPPLLVPGLLAVGAYFGVIALVLFFLAALITMVLRHNGASGVVTSSWQGQ